MDVNLREHCTGEGIYCSIGGQPGHANTCCLLRANLLALLRTRYLTIMAQQKNMLLSQHIEYDVEDARDVPGDIALEAGGKSVGGELSLVQIKYEANQRDESEGKREGKEDGTYNRQTDVKVD